MLFLFLFLSVFSVNSNLEKNLPASVFNLDEFVPARSNLNYLNLREEDLKAESVLVKEFYGKTLFSKNSQEELPIASLTKLMSSYIASLIFTPEDIFIFDQESISQEGEVGWFYSGEKINFVSALKASLVASSNDAIYLLAKSYGLEKFINLMNNVAQNWNLTKTKFVDPTGLGKENISSAYDLFKLMEKVYSQKPEIFSYTTLERVNINGKILWTTNLLLPKYKNYFVGAKTGYTDFAGECLMAILKFENSSFVGLVLLNSKDRWSDTEKIIQALKVYYGE